MKKLGLYATVLIALYLVVDNGTNSTNVAKGLSGGGIGIIEALQGRTA